jgi:hypothetical protein
MSVRCARSMGALVVLATWGALSACAGSSERLPECKGRAVPINGSGLAAVPDVRPSTSPAGIVAAQGSEGGARDAQ